MRRSERRPQALWGKERPPCLRQRGGEAEPGQKGAAPGRRWTLPPCPSARQEGWSQVCPLVLPKATGQISPRLHRFGVSRECRAVPSIQRPSPSEEASRAHPPRLTPCALEISRSSSSACPCTQKEANSARERDSAEGAELRAAHGLLAPRPVSVPRLLWGWQGRQPPGGALGGGPLLDLGPSPDPAGER